MSSTACGVVMYGSSLSAEQIKEIKYRTHLVLECSICGEPGDINFCQYCGGKMQPAKRKLRELDLYGLDGTHGCRIIVCDDRQYVAVVASIIEGNTPFKQSQIRKIEEWDTALLDFSDALDMQLFEPCWLLLVWLSY